MIAERGPGDLGLVTPQGHRRRLTALRGFDSCTLATPRFGSALAPADVEGVARPRRWRVRRRHHLLKLPPSSTSPGLARPHSTRGAHAFRPA